MQRLPGHKHEEAQIDRRVLRVHRRHWHHLAVLGCLLLLAGVLPLLRVLQLELNLVSARTLRRDLRELLIVLRLPVRFLRIFGPLRHVTTMALLFVAVRLTCGEM
jgi:hypothetical protein